jgi:nitrogen regulatory protein PII-like uncharacterized protein
MKIVLNKNDDRVMLELLSGSYTGTPDAHVFFIKYPLAYLIKTLYTIVPTLHWYGILLLGSQLLALATILYCVIQKSDSTRKMIGKSLVLILLYSFFWMQRISNASFTYAAAALGTAAIVFLATNKMNLQKYIYAVFLLIATFCWRQAVFLMVAPMCGILFLPLLFENKKIHWKVLLAPCILCITLFTIQYVHKNAYSGKEWSMYQEYDAYRAQVYDYVKFPDYEENQELYTENGISKSEYLALKTWNVAVVGEDSIPIFQAIYENVKQEQYSVSDIIEAVQLVLYKFLQDDCRIYNFAALIVWGLGTVACLCQKKRNEILLHGCLTGIYILQYLYLGIQGRILERVVAPMYLLLFLLGVIQLYRNRMIVEKNLNRFILVNLLVITAGMFTCEWKSCRENNIEQWRINKDYEKLVSYCNSHTENYYIIDTVTLREYTDNIHWIQEKKQENNYIMMGDWHAFSPMYYQKLAHRFDSSDLKKLAVEQDNVYVIWKAGMNMSYLKDLWETSSIEIEKEKNVRGKYMTFCVRKCSEAAE